MGACYARRAYIIKEALTFRPRGKNETFHGRAQNLFRESVKARAIMARNKEIADRANTSRSCTVFNSLSKFLTHISGLSTSEHS